LPASAMWGPDLKAMRGPQRHPLRVAWLVAVPFLAVIVVVGLLLNHLGHWAGRGDVGATMLRLRAPRRCVVTARRWGQSGQLLRSWNECG
jgi:hypothetical protein